MRLEEMPMASAQKEKESLKKHGDAVNATERAARDGDGRSANVDPIPAPERGGHERSHAAHPGAAVHEHTHRAGPHPGASPGEMHPPPQLIGRTGKAQRKQ